MAKDEDTENTYVLKRGAEHNAIVAGEAVTFKGGDTIVLNDAQFQSFKDKLVLPEQDEASIAEEVAEQSKPEPEAPAKPADKPAVAAPAAATK